MENKQLANRHFCTARSLEAQRGITLLEIMIVLAIIGLVMGVLVGPRVFQMFAKSKEKLALIEAQDLAYTAYSLWQNDNGDAACPTNLDELSKFTNKPGGIKDPWGTAYEMKCGEGLPEGIAFGVFSAGPDRKTNTPDDIHSWDAKPQKK
jgi:general secretion pathway protein G